MNTDNSTQETITIQLTKGQVAVIDDIDADLAEFNWHALSVRGGYYASRHSARPNSVTILLHRTILERMIGRPLTRTEYTDHISGNTLDNRRENLRLASPSENGQNRGKPSTNTSGFKGVSWYSHNRKWRARIEVNGKRIHLGYFDSPEEAHAAYIAAAQKLHGEFANTGVFNDGR